MASVKISKGKNSKLGDSVCSVSLTAGDACRNSKYCKKDCYARRCMARKTNVLKRYAENLQAYRGNPDRYFQDIIGQLSRMRKPVRFFRWHVSGDILGQRYLCGMCLVAATFPNIRFLAFTKMFKLDYAIIPPNLQIVWSAWPGMPIPIDRARELSIPIAWMQNGEETRIPPYAKECPGTCENCGSCWTAGHDVVFHKH